MLTKSIKTVSLLCSVFLFASCGAVQPTNTNTNVQPVVNNNTNTVTTAPAPEFAPDIQTQLENRTKEADQTITPRIPE